MPQLNLFYYPQVACSLLFFYFLGYFFFFRWTLGQLMLLTKVRNYLSRIRRTNPLGSLVFFGGYEFAYSESLLFVVEFVLLFFLLVKIVDLVLPSKFDFKCQLYQYSNPYLVKRVNLVRALSNMYILLNHFQGDHFYQLACSAVSNATRSVLSCLNFTFQRSLWVENLFQVFIPKLHRTCRQIGPE